MTRHRDACLRDRGSARARSARLGRLRQRRRSTISDATSSSPCSARRAAARPPCCASSPASSTRMPARSPLGGHDLLRLRPHRRPVNLMFQSYALFPHMSVERNVAYGLEREGVAKDEMRRAGRRGAGDGGPDRQGHAGGPISSPAASGSGSPWLARSSSDRAAVAGRAAVRPRQARCAPRCSSSSSGFSTSSASRSSS